MGDINNAYETLERALKKIGIVLIDEQEDIKNGKPSQIIALVRKMLISTSTTVAKQMLLKGCPSHATDKKLAIAAFDVLRDSKQAPNISIDQFFNQGFVHHKLVILSRLADYVSNTSKSPRPTVMSAFVTQPEIIATNVFSDYYDSSPSKPYIAVDSSESDWPLSDFIRQHIIDNKVNTDAMTRKEFKKTILRSRSTTNVNSSTTDESKDKTNNKSNRFARGNSPIQQIRPVNRHGFGGSLNEDENDEDADEGLNFAVKVADDDDAAYQREIDNAYERGRTSPTSHIYKGGNRTARSGNTVNKASNTDYKNNDSESIDTYVDVDGHRNTSFSNNNNINKPSPSSSRKKVSLMPTEPVDRAAAAPVVVTTTLSEQDASEMAIRIETEVQKRLEQYMDRVVEERVAEAVLEVTQKYDFIINKLVAAVDAEFTLLNNQLRMANSPMKTTQGNVNL